MGSISTRGNEIFIILRYGVEANKCLQNFIIYRFLYIVINYIEYGRKNIFSVYNNNIFYVMQVIKVLFMLRIEAVVAQRQVCDCKRNCVGSYLTQVNEIINILLSQELGEKWGKISIHS